jgi:nucleoside-diphosphate-sugar epimerase
MTRRVLVTGSNGLVGSHLVEALLAAGYRVRCMIRRSSDLRLVQHLRGGPTEAGQVEWVYADVTDPAAVREAVAGVDAVCHCAAQTRALDEATYLRVNAGGTKAMLAACVEAAPGLQRFVYCSSAAATGPSNGTRPREEADPPEPLTPYGRSKLAAEAAVRRYADRLPVTIVRPAPVYGPRDRDILAYFQLIKWRLSLRLGRGQRWLSLVYVRDLARLLLQATEDPAAVGQTYNACDGEAYTWDYLATEIERAMDRRALKIELPMAVLKPMSWGANALARLTGKPPLLHEQRLIEIRQQAWVYSGEKARRELGFEPAKSLPEALDETVAWYRKEGWL